MEWIDSRNHTPPTEAAILVWCESEPDGTDGIVWAQWREASRSWTDVRRGSHRLAFRFWQPAPVSPYPSTTGRPAPRPAVHGTWQIWQVWQEGYAATGGQAVASFCGTFLGETFSDACAAWVATLSAGSRSSFNRQELAYWGCRLFDNEVDARQRFG